MRPLKPLDQRIVALERRRQRTVSNDRRRDIREKIALGGLVVRAGLRGADRAYLLGVLLEAAAVQAGSPEHHRLKAAGAIAFRSERVNDTETVSAKTRAARNAEKASEE